MANNRNIPIKIELPDNFGQFISSIDNLKSSEKDKFMDAFMNVLGPLDRFLTLARVDGALETVYTGESTIGAVNTTFSKHHGIGAGWYAFLVIYTIYCPYLNKTEKAKNRKELADLYQLYCLTMTSEQSQHDEAKEQDTIPNKNIVHKLNKALDEIRKKLPQYSRIAIQGNELVFNKIEENNDDVELQPLLSLDDNETTQSNKPAKKQKNFLHRWVWDWFLKHIMWDNIIQPLWDSGVIASLTFWIIWIAAAATTGLQLEGVAGVTTWVSLGIPALLGMTYLGLHFKEAIKNRGFNNKAKKDEREAAALTEDLLTEALHRVEYEYALEKITEKQTALKKKLENQYQFYAHLIDINAKEEKENTKVKVGNGLADNPYMKGGLTAFLSGRSYFTGAQTPTWYLKVLVETAYVGVLSLPVLGTVFGSIIIGLSFLFAVANGVNRYKESKKFNKDCQNGISLESAEKFYRERAAILLQLKTEIDKVYSEHSSTKDMPEEIPRILRIEKKEEPKTIIGRVKQWFIDKSFAIRDSKYAPLLDIKFEGLLLARVLFTTAATFLPFAPVLVTGPAGLAVILGIGLFYLIVKTYDEALKRREQRLKALPDQIEKQEKEIELAKQMMCTMQLAVNLAPRTTAAPSPAPSTQPEKPKCFPPLFRESNKALGTIMVYTTSPKLVFVR